MNYWDASALVPLVVKERSTKAYIRIAKRTEIVTWCGSYLECTAAIARLARHGSAPPQVAQSYRMLDELAGRWREVEQNEPLRRAATRMLRTHTLRAGDALQLGAALVASGFAPHTVRFLTEDKRLRTAAEREGFLVA